MSDSSIARRIKASAAEYRAAGEAKDPQRQQRAYREVQDGLTEQGAPPDKLGELAQIVIFGVDPLDKPQALYSVETLAQAWPNIVPLEWIWNGWLPRTGLVLFAGIEGKGKTTLALRIAADITKGNLAGQNGEPGRVAVWSNEDHPSITAGRLMLYGADPDKVVLLGLSKPFHPGNRDHLKRELDRLETDPVDVFILDPLMSLVVGDNNTAKDIRDSIEPVLGRLNAMGTTLLGLGHFTKDSSDRAIVQRYMGAGGYTQLARAMWVLVEANDRLMFGKAKVSWGDRRGVYDVRIAANTVEYHNGERREVGLAELGDVDVDRNIDQMERSERAKEREDKTEDNDTAKAILDTLRDEGGKLDRKTLVNAVKDGYGHGVRTVEKWLAKMLERGDIIGRPATPDEKAKAGNVRNLRIIEVPAERHDYTHDI